MTITQFNNNYDVFHSFLVENADYDGYFELPVIRTSNQLPNKVITFSKAMSKAWRDYDCWVIFYEHDRDFERLWNNPKQYLNKLKNSKALFLRISVCTEICRLLCKCGIHIEAEQ